MNNLVLSCQSVSKSFKDGAREVQVLNQLDLAIEKAELIGIIGASGSGKSTLLHIMGGLDQPTKGVVKIDNHDLVKLSTNELSKVRNQEIGFIYQFHHLLMEFTAAENVMMPLLIGGMSPKKAQEKAEKILARVGLAERVTHRPSELSGGERQRVAIARALVNEPKLVLADEPTGNLDQDTASEIFALINELNTELGICFVIVTHDLDIARQMQRVYRLDHGQLQQLDSV
jgi:lipoprotein-releasing system ATP-binding protein